MSPVMKVTYFRSNHCALLNLKNGTLRLIQSLTCPLLCAGPLATFLLHMLLVIFFFWTVYSAKSCCKRVGSTFQHRLFSSASSCPWLSCLREAPIACSICPFGSLQDCVHFFVTASFLKPQSSFKQQPCPRRIMGNQNAII